MSRANLHHEVESVGRGALRMTKGFQTSRAASSTRWVLRNTYKPLTTPQLHTASNTSKTHFKSSTSPRTCLGIESLNPLFCSDPGQQAYPSCVRYTYRSTFFPDLTIYPPKEPQSSSQQLIHNGISPLSLSSCASRVLPPHSSCWPAVDIGRTLPTTAKPVQNANRIRFATGQGSSRSLRCKWDALQWLGNSD